MKDSKAELRAVVDVEMERGHLFAQELGLKPMTWFNLAGCYSTAHVDRVLGKLAARLEEAEKCQTSTSDT